MRKKIAKGLYCLAIMMITLGTAFLVPSFVAYSSGLLHSEQASTKVEGAESLNEEGEVEDPNEGFGFNVEDYKTQYVLDQDFIDLKAAMADENNKALLEANSVAMSSNVSKPNYNNNAASYYTIDNKQDLITVAYNILNGSTDWASRNYILTDNIDLGGALWTPIGTQANPFTGIFYGGFYVISNVVVYGGVSTATDTAAGLFGRVTSGSIQNLIVKNYRLVGTSNFSGAVVGTLDGGSTVANCYVLAEDGSTNNTPYGVGQTNSTTGVYRGGSRDGVDPDYMTASAIAATLKVNGTPGTEGYAISYKASGGRIMQYYSRTDASNTAYQYSFYGAMVNTSGTVAASRGFYGNIPTTRAAAMAAQSGAFAINEGNEVVIDTPSASNGYISTLSWIPRNDIVVTVHYCYNKNDNGSGTNATGERTESITVPYDYAWLSANALGGKSFIRTGYTLADDKYYFNSTYSSKVGVAGGYFVGDSMGQSGSTYNIYLKWAANTGIGYNIEYATPTNDVGFDPNNAFSSFSVYEGTTSNEVTKTAGTTYKWDIAGHTASNSVILKFKLNWGYRFVSGQSNTDGMNKVQIGTPSLDTAGISFAGSYDTYRRPNYSATVDGDGEYTITIQDVVGSGQIYLVVERIEYNVKLNGVAVDWTLSNLKNAKGETTNTYTYFQTPNADDSLSSSTASTYLKTRVGESFNIKADRKEAGEFIANYNALNFADSVVNAIPGTQPEGIKHYINYAWEIKNYIAQEAADAEYAGEIIATAKALVVKLTVEVVYSEEEEAWIAAHPEITKAVAGAYVNTDSGFSAGTTDQNTFTVKLFNNEDGNEDINSTNGMVRAYLHENAYFNLASHKIEVPKNSTHVPTASKENIEAENGYMRNCVNFDVDYKDNTDTEENIYKITLTPQRQTYKAKYNIYIDGELAENQYISAGDAQLVTAPDAAVIAANREPFETISNVKFELTTTVGQNVLVFDKIELVKDMPAEGYTGDYRAKIESTRAGSLVDGTYTVATSDTVINVYYTRKSITFDLEMKAYVDGVNGTTGADKINTILDTAEKTLGLAYKTGEESKRSITAKISFDGNSLEFLGGNISNIDLMYGYYLLGWYLKNGDVVSLNPTAGAEGIPTTGDHLGWVKAAKEAETQATAFVMVKQKTVTLSFNKGNDPLVFVNTEFKDYSKVTDNSVSYTYYHDQEEFADLFVDTKPTAFAFSSVQDFIHKIAMEPVSKWTGNWSGADHVFASTSNFSTTTTKDVPYGNANEAQLQFLPVFEDYLIYTSDVYYKNPAEKAGSMQIKLTDKVVMTAGENGTATYSINGVTFTTPEFPGYTATGFKFKGNNHESAVGTEFVLSEAVIIDYLPTAYYYEVPANGVFEIETVYEANTYKVFIDLVPNIEIYVEGAEIDTDGRYFVYATYGQSVTALQNVVVTRAGYDLAGYASSGDREVKYAVTDGTDWTFPTTFLSTADIHVKPLWERKVPSEGEDGYIKINDIGNKEITFNGTYQTVATATFKIDGTASPNLDLLENGDRVVSQYWAKAGDTTKSIGNDLSLALRNVSESGKYVYVVNVQSQANLYADPYTLVSNEFQVTINPSAVIPFDYALKGYFTGTGDYLAASDTKVGVLRFTDESTIADTIVAATGYSFTGNDGEGHNAGFIVGTNREVRIALTFGENEIGNFKDIRGNETDGYYIVAAIGEIVKTNLTVTLSGKGFEVENMLHEIPFTAASDNYNLNSYSFKVDATIKTGDWHAGLYSDGNITSTIKVTKGEETTDLTDNFNIVYVDSYEIVAASVIYNYDVRYLTAGNGSLKNSDGQYRLSGTMTDFDNTAKITGVTISGKAVNVDFNEENIYYLDSVTKAPIFTIFGNGTANVKIAIDNNYLSTLKFTVEVTNSDNLAFLGYFESNAITNYEAILDAYTTQVRTTSPELRETKITYYAVYTDAKAVTISGTDSDSTVYISASIGYTFATPTRTGFTFNEWQMGNGVTATISGVNTQVSVAGSVPSTLTATWTLDAPTATDAKNTITKSASTGAQNITLSEVIGNIGNLNNSHINYTYEWKKGSTSLSTKDLLTFNKLTTLEAGEYSLIVTATTKDSAQTQATTFTFTLAVERLQIDSFVLSSQTAVYANTDFAATLSATLNIAGVNTPMTVGSNLDNSQYIYFTITKGTSVDEIKTVGDYSIALNVDTTIYEVATTVDTSLVFEVTKAPLAITGETLRKAFGQADPALVITKTVNGELVSVTFERVAGEAVGSYPMTYKSCDNANYNVTATNNNFVIEKLTSNLRVTLASNFSMTYNGKTIASFAPRYLGEETKAWYLLALDSEGNELARVALSLTYQDPASSRILPVTTNIDKAFDGFTISTEGTVKNVGSYPLSCDGSSATYDGIEFTSEYSFAISKASLTVTSISKVFDENADFTWTAGVNGTTTIAVEGLAEGDVVTISGSLAGVTVGDHAIASIAVSGNDNYNTTVASQPEKATVTISDVDVDLSASNLTFDYAEINKTLAHNAADLASLLNLVFKANNAASNALAAGYITLSSVTIGTDADYSTGEFLKVGSYNVVFTLTSTNYSKANGTFTIEGLTINQITVDLSENVVTKIYDGKEDLPSMTWVIKTIAQGDKVSVAGKYTSSAISTGIVLELNLTGDDAANYKIDESTMPKGSITSRVINLTANLNTTTFVDGYTFAPATKNIEITYTGSVDAFITDLESKFASKTGYTQTGWTYGENTKLDSAHFADFLAKAIEADTAYDIYAVWEINELTINVTAANATLKNGDVTVTNEIKINYFDSLTLTITGNTGYRYNSYSYTGETTSVTVPTGVTNTETLTLTNVISGGTLTINMAEIQVNVIIDMSQAPAACEASAEWTTKQLGLATNKDALALSVLPNITTKTGTYDFDYFTVGETKVVDETTFMSTLADVTKDSSVTFVAHFKAAALDLTISHEHADIVVKIGDETITATDGVYKVYYNANVNVTITGKEGWKLASVSHEDGEATSYNVSGEGNLNASLTIEAIKNAQTVVITMAEIQVTVKADANTGALINTAIISDSAWTTKVYNYSALNDTVDNLLDTMRVTAGTYTQTGWTYDNKPATSSNLLELVKTANGENDLTADYTLTVPFKPIWVGVNYEITFYPNGNENRTVTITDAAEDGTKTISAVYGSAITMPKTQITSGWNFTWNTLQTVSDTDKGTTYNPKGDTLRTIGTLSGDKYTLNLYAQYVEGSYKLTVTFDSHVTKLLNGTDEVASGTQIDVLGATDVTLVPTLEEGYEIDKTLTKLGQESATVTVDNNGHIVLSGITSATTLNIVTKASTYRYYIDAMTYENVTGANLDVDKYYVDVVYKQNLADTALNNVRITRNGYVLTALKDSDGNIVANFKDDAWTFVITSHNTPSDVTLTPVWEADDDYYTITFDTENATATYTSEAQKLVTASFNVNGVVTAWNAALTNGDTLVDYYFAKVGEGDTLTKVAAGAELNLRNVADSGNYVLVFTIRDTRTGEERTLQSIARPKVTISKAELGITGANLVSYYTGTTTYSAVAGTANNGSFVIGEKATTDASLNRFEFVTAQVVGSNYDIRAYISMSADNRANYSNIHGSDTDGYYILLDGAASVVASPIVITAKGSGYYTGSVHTVSYGVSTTVSGLNLDNFDITLSLKTKADDTSVGKKTAFDDKDFNVLLGATDVTGSFAYSVTGEYEILSTENANTYTLTPAFLGTESTATFTISNLSVDGENVVVSGAFMNYVNESGEVEFSLAGNGTNKIVLVANKANVVKFDVTVSNLTAPYDFVGFTTDNSEANMKSMLAALTTSAARTATITLTDNVTAYGVVTNMKAITINYGDKAAEETLVYGIIGDEVEFATPTWTGFTFNSFDAPNGITYVSEKLGVDSSLNILPITITAKWTLAKPIASDNNNSLTFKAGEGNETISVASVIGTITNTADDANVTYTYAWFNAKNEQIGTGDSLAIAANTDSNGAYYVVVTANKTGYTSAVSEHVDFTVTITPVTLTVSTEQNAKVTYANKDFADEIMFTLTIDGVAQPAKSLKTLLADGNIKMTVAGGENDGVIKNIGSYTITLVANGKIYNAAAYTFNIEVEKYSYEIKDTDVNLSKNFGAADPALKTTLNLLGEDVEVTFTRESGETVGSYKLSIVESYNANYKFTIDENNKYFTIESGDGKLQIEVYDTSVLSKVYNKKNTTFAAKFVDGKWILYVYNDGESNAFTSTTLTLNTLASGVPTEVTGDALKIALDGAKFTISGDNMNVGDYTIVVTTGTNYKTTEFADTVKFNVTAKELTVSSITKVFDKTANFTTENVTFTGLVEGDSVTITGAFNSATAGSQTIESITLGGTDAGNYSLKSDSATCTITPSDAEITLDVDNLSFEYGNISNETDLKAFLTAEIKVGGNAITAEDEIDYTVSIGSAVYSNSNYLNANSYTLTFTITTPNYSKAGAITKTLVITKKALDLTGSVVTKAYDDTADLPEGQTWVLGGLIEGDRVEITGTYATKDKGTNKELLLSVVQSGDGVNYEIGTTVTGTISDAIVKLVVDYTTRANFVDEQSVASSEFFNIEYPANKSASEILAGLTYPTRIGYHVTGWQFNDGTQYVDITEANILQVLDRAFAAENKTLTIFASWTIDQVEITVNVTNATLAHANLAGNKITVNYYDYVTVSITGAEGWKFMNATLTSGTIAGEVTKTNTGKREGSFSLSHVKANTVIDVTMEEIVITVKVDANIPEFTEMSNGPIADVTYLYSQVNAPAIGLLTKPTVTAGTYTLTGFTTGANTIALDSSDTLKLILGTVNEDTEITFTANWIGQEYTIYFDANGGEITNDVTSISATFGQATTETFAKAARTGMNYTWNTSVSGNGDTYSDGDILTTVGTAGTNGYELTLYAIWANNEVTLTVVFTDPEITSVRVGDDIITSGKTYSLVYSQDEVEFTISTAQGYTFAYALTNKDDGEIRKLNSTITVSMLNSNSTLTISKDALENNLTIVNTLSEVENVTVDGEEVEISEGVVVAKTGTEVVLTIKPNAGYIFDEKSKINVEGSGSITTKLVGENIEITYTGFNSNSTLNVTPSAKLNTITIKDSSAYIQSLTINGSVISVKGGTYQAATGTELTINVTLNYGYVNSDLTFVGATLAPEASAEDFDETLRVYTRAFTLSGFTSDFEMNVTASPREYEFDIDSANFVQGSVTTSGLTENSAAFGSTITLTASPNENYVFEGWYVGEQFISSSATLAFTLDANNRDILESGYPVTIRAHFASATREITITSGFNGKLEYKVAENEEDFKENKFGEKVTVLENDSKIATFKLGNVIVITPIANPGYEVESVTLYNSSNVLIPGEWYKDGVVTITIGQASAVTRIEVTFKASVAVVNIVAAAEINYQISYGVDFGGKVWLASETGTKLNDTTDNGYNYTYSTITGTTFYLLVEPKGGESAYSYDLTSTDEGVIINRSRTNPNLYEIVGAGVRDGITISAIFTANNLSVGIRYENDGAFVSAGSISAQIGGFVVAAGNNSSDVLVSALAGQDFTVNLYTNLSYSFFDKDGKPDITIAGISEASVVVEAIENYTDEQRMRTGFSQHAVLKVSDLNANGSITIKVVPKRYRIVLLSDGNQVGGALSGITYGQQLSISDSQSIIPESRDGYEFKGYYTMELGQGRMYINELGQAVQNWEENGYKWNGAQYERSTYFKGEDTFELYAGWYYTKERITLDFIPDELKDKIDAVNILNFVTATDQDVTIWMSGDNKYYAEAQEGKRIALRAYNFEGYTFKYWSIDRGNGDIENIAGNVYEYTTKNGDVSITAVYEANYSLEVYNEGLEIVDPICGTVELRQNNIALTSGSFDTTKPVTIVAVNNPGFKFKGWYNLKTSDWLRGASGEIITDSIYTFEDLLTEELKLRAVFEGSEIGVRIDLSGLTYNSEVVGSLGTVYLNGQEVVNTDTEFEARVGDTIKVEINTNYNFGVTWNGAVFAIGEDGLFTYRIMQPDLEKVTDAAHEYVLTIRPVADPNPITYEFELMVENDATSGEIQLVGALRYQSRELSTGSRIDALFGHAEMRIDVALSSYYRIGGVYIEVSEIRYDITRLYVDSQRQIRLTSDILETYDAGVNAHIIINYTRVLWTDYRSDALSGMGTRENPYKITSAEDLAFLAYAVNNGQTNANGDYKDAYYEVTRDIDLGGKYWVPIGTADQRFNGVINLGEHQIKNISHYMTYLPNTYYEGLIWYLTENAQVITTNNNLVLALSIAGGVLILLILIVIIIVITRKKKKKKLDELANS